MKMEDRFLSGLHVGAAYRHALYLLDFSSPIVVE